MLFLLTGQEWISSHVEHIPDTTRDFCGDLSGHAALDVGCGDMIADIGLLRLGLKHIDGVDIVAREDDPRETAAQAVRTAGFAVPPDYAKRLTYTKYDGLRFPFPDNHFDFVFSWSAFEHINNVPALLGEIRRVVKPSGRVFLQVYPWFHAFLGSHLTDFISEPFFHLRRSQEWVEEQLRQYVRQHPERGEAALQIWPEFQRLNGYSGRRFLLDIMEAGFCVEKVESFINEEGAWQAPAEVPVADVITVGSKVLLRACKPS